VFFWSMVVALFTVVAGTELLQLRDAVVARRRDRASGRRVRASEQGSLLSQM
jgi:hypothetical protein